LKKYALVVAAALFTLVGCSSGSEEAAQPTPSRSEAQSSTSATVKPSPAQTETADPAPVLRDAVYAYSDEFLTGNGYDAYKRLTKRCQAKMDKNYFEGLTLAAKSQIGNLPIKTYAEKLDGDSATVTYTYSDASINQTDEPWILVGGKWLNDQC